MGTENLANGANKKIKELKNLVSEAVESNKEDLDRLRANAEEFIRENSGKAKDAAADLDEAVHKNPWAYVAGFAAAALFVGYLMGNSKKNG